jgi:hypothetical protein
MPEPIPIYVAAPVKKVSRRRRWMLGCGVALWFAFLMLPCFFLIMLTQGQIVVRTGELPEQSIRIWLVNEARQRGFGIAVPSTHAGEGGQRCLQTDVRFVSWLGSAEPATYCECYDRESEAEEWSLLSTNPAACE